LTEDLVASLPPKTTERQRKFFEIWATKYKFSFDDGALAKAYVEAGYSPYFANKNAQTALYSSNLNRVVRIAMEKHNITIDCLVAKHAELLEAKHPFAPEQPDNIVQFKAFQEGMKLYGGYPVPIQKVDVTHSEEYHISVEDQRRADKTLQECIDVEIIENGNGDGDELLDAEAPLV
jgi:hypothetical protein